MHDVTLVILNSLRIKCHIRRPLTCAAILHKSTVMKFLTNTTNTFLNVCNFEGFTKRLKRTVHTDKQTLFFFKITNLFAL